MGRGSGLSLVTHERGLAANVFRSGTGVSAVLNFMWLPNYPVWGLIIIALDMTVIWALSVHGREFTR
jgi:hypothetical protein